MYQMKKMGQGGFIISGNIRDTSPVDLLNIPENGESSILFLVTF